MNLTRSHRPFWIGATNAFGRVRHLYSDGRPLSIVMYHSISRHQSPFAISPRAFRNQIQFLRDHYPIIRLSEVHRRLVSPTCERAVVLTFDDAYEDFADCALPILEAFGTPATLFVPTGMIGKSNLWDHDLPDLPRLRVMKWEQVREAAGSPYVEIGSHGVDHLSMRRLAAGEMRHQAVESKRQLETRLENTVTMFAYPYGTLSDFSNATTCVLSEGGYKIAVTSHWGTTNSSAGILSLRRIVFGNADTMEELQAKVEGDYDWMAIKEWGGYALRSIGIR